MTGWGYKVTRAAIIVRILFAGLLGILAYEGGATWLVPQLNAAQNSIQIPSPAGNVLIGGVIALAVLAMFLYVFGLGVKFSGPVQTFGGGNRKK